MTTFTPDFSLQNIRAAIYTLYHANDKNQHSLANQFLMKFQSFPQAWEVAGQLLSQENSSYEEKYFSAQTLYLKLNNQWGTLNATTKEQIRRLIVECIIKYNKNKALLTRLCVALAVFTLNSIAEAEKGMDIFKVFALPNIDMNILDFKSPENPTSIDMREAFLEFLTVLPEQLETTVFIPVTMGVVQKELTSAEQVILPYLLNYIKPENKKVELHFRQKALRCLHSWVKFGIPLSFVYSDGSLISCILHCLQERELFIQGANVLEEILSLNAETKHEQAVRFYMKKLVDLVHIFNYCVQKRDDEVCHAYVKLIVALADAQTMMLVEGHEECVTLVKLILHCCNHPNKKIVELTFDFWYSLQSSLNEEEEQKIYREIFAQLVLILMKQCEIPKDFAEMGKCDIQDSSQNVDEEEFNEFRMYAADTLMSPYYLLFDNYFKLCYQKLEEALQLFQQTQEWRPLEAVLFAISAVCDVTRKSQVSSLSPILFKLPTLPSQPSFIKFAIIRIIGGFAKIVAKLDEKFVIWCFKYILDEIYSQREENPVFTVNVAKEFGELCEHAVDFFGNHIQLAQQIVGGCLQGIHKLKAIHKEKVYEGLSFIAIGVENDANVQMDILMKILGQIAQRIQEYQQQQVNKQNAECLIQELSQLKAAFRGFSGEEPQPILLQVVMKVWPLVERVLAQYQTYENIIQATCDLCKTIACSLGNFENTFSFCNQVFDLMCSFFEHFPYSCVLDVIGVVCGTNQQSENVIRKNYPKVCMKTFSILSKDLDSNSDLIRQFFAFIKKINQYHPHLILQNVNFSEQLFDLAVACVDYYDKSTAFNVITFLEDFIKKDVNINEQQNYQYLILHFSQSLIKNVFHALLYKDSQNSYTLFRIIIAYLQKFPKILHTHAWNTLMDTTIEANSKITEEDKRYFIKCLTSSTQSNHVKDAIINLKTKIKSKTLKRVQLITE